MSLNKHPRKNNPLKPQRNFKDFVKFTAIAILMLVAIDVVILKGERPYITKMKQDYWAEQILKDKALEESLPPKVVFPDDGKEYFEAPELRLKDEQSLLPEKQLNITKLAPDKEAFEEVILDATKEKVIIPKTPRKKFTDGKPKIAIVIDDVGMNIKQSQAAINLPAEVTLALLPYASNVRDMAKEGKAKGHELIIHTPMEAMSKDVPLGDLALYSDMNKNAFKAEFNKIAGSFDGYVGINNHMGSKLTQDSDAMNMVMNELKDRKLYFLDSRTIAGSIAADTAYKRGIPYAVRDVFLDHEDTPEFLEKALKKTEKIARNHGSAIAIGHPKQVTMAALQKWIPTLGDRGFELVPLSMLIHGKSQTAAKTEKPAVKKATEIEEREVKATNIKTKSSVEPLTWEDQQVVIPPPEGQDKEKSPLIIPQNPPKDIEMMKVHKDEPIISYPVN